MKKLVLLVSVALLASSAAFAAPVMKKGQKATVLPRQMPAASEVKKDDKAEQPVEMERFEVVGSRLPKAKR